jgi:anthranilate synthase/aminodeoxychorismate synthase-like glutamine amidotransferase
MLTLIDNYDSFTYNLVHFLGELGAPARVYRNDKVTVDEVLAEAPEAIVLSPGPCDPDRAGICLELIARAGPDVPILGVCLGHQAIGQVYGGRVVRAPTLMHGKLSKVHHSGKGVFAGVSQDFSATRYHSLVVGRAAQALPRAWRSVPPREHRVGARASAPRQLPRSCQGGAARQSVEPKRSGRCPLIPCWHGRQSSPICGERSPRSLPAPASARRKQPKRSIS